MTKGAEPVRAKGIPGRWKRAQLFMACAAFVFQFIAASGLSPSLRGADLLKLSFVGSAYAADETQGAAAPNAGAPDTAGATPAAQTGAAAAGAPMTPFQFIFGTVQFFLLGFFIYFWMAIRPQQLRDEERRKFRNDLKKNDEVITSGGIYGKVVSLKDESVTLDVGSGVKLRVHLDSVSPPPPESARPGGDASRPGQQRISE